MQISPIPDTEAEHILDSVHSSIRHHRIVIVVFLLFTLFFVLFSAAFGYYKGFADAERQGQMSLIEQAQQYDQELALQEEMFESCRQNQGFFLDSSTEMYEFKTFGLYHPLFDGTEVQVVRYNYCGDIVIAKSLSFGEMGRVTVYYYEGEKRLPNRAFFLGESQHPSQMLQDIPTFGGYENYANRATMVSQLSKNWTADNSIENDMGMTFYFKENYMPKRVGSVSLEHYSTFSPMGRSFYANVSYSLQDPYADDAESQIQAAQESLTEISQNLDIKL